MDVGNAGSSARTCMRKRLHRSSLLDGDHLVGRAFRGPWQHGKGRSRDPYSPERARIAGSSGRSADLARCHARLIGFQEVELHGARLFVIGMDTDLGRLLHGTPPKCQGSVLETTVLGEGAHGSVSNLRLLEGS